MKRVVDVCSSMFGLLFLSPIFIVVAILIKKEDSGPIFYKGIRVGKDGKLFHMYKFRSMVVNADKMGASSTSDDDSRITKTGLLLRKYKLDELPQLINVFLGDMSLVGPRPQIQWAVKLYTEKEKMLLSVRPGITDYASIRFRNEGEILKGSTDPDKDYMEKIAGEKNRLGLEYIQKRSFWVDLGIIFDTIKLLFFKSSRGM